MTTCFKCGKILPINFCLRPGEYVMCKECEEKWRRTEEAIVEVMRKNVMDLKLYGCDQAVEQGGESMTEAKYSVIMNNETVAKDLPLDVASILVKALFETYFAMPSLTIAISRQDEEGV